MITSFLDAPHYVGFARVEEQVTYPAASRVDVLILLRDEVGFELPASFVSLGFFSLESSIIGIHRVFLAR